MAGNIRIIEPSSNFQKVAKGIIFCKEIDPFTLGIYVKVLALGKAWQLNINGLASYLELTEAKIRKSFAILEQAGYMRRQRVRDEKNHFVGWDYEFSTIPFSDLADSRHSENPDVGKTRTSENPQVYNKTIIQEEDLKNKKQEEGYIYSASRFTPPSIEEVASYCQSRNNGIDPQAFMNYYEAVGWMVGKSKMKDWRAAVRNWETRRRNDPTSQAPRPRQQQPQESVYARNARAFAEFERRIQMQYADEQ